MQFEKFVEKVRQAGHLIEHTGFSGIKVTVNKEHTVYILKNEFVCKCCKTRILRKVMIEFHEPHQMTVFEADLMYFLYCLNKKPSDYAGYHNCIAGKKFIENIKAVGVGE